MRHRIVTFNQGNTIEQATHYQRYRIIVWQDDLNLLNKLPRKSLNWSEFQFKRKGTKEEQANQTNICQLILQFLTQFHLLFYRFEYLRVTKFRKADDIFGSCYIGQYYIILHPGLKYNKHHTFLINFLKAQTCSYFLLPTSRLTPSDIQYSDLQDLLEAEKVKTYYIQFRLSTLNWPLYIILP